MSIKNLLKSTIFHVKTNQMQRCIIGDNFYVATIDLTKFFHINSAIYYPFIFWVKILIIKSTCGSSDTNHSELELLLKVPACAGTF